MANQRRRQPEAQAPPTADKRGRYVVRPQWLRAVTLIHVGLIVLGVYILQAFISTNAADLAARVSIVAWAVAIPLLAFLALVNQTQEGFRYAAHPAYLGLASALAQGSAVFGFAAAVWHLWMPASLVLIASGLAGFALYRVYYRRLVRDNKS